MPCQEVAKLATAAAIVRMQSPAAAATGYQRLCGITHSHAGLQWFWQVVLWCLLQQVCAPVCCLHSLLPLALALEGRLHNLLSLALACLLCCLRLAICTDNCTSAASAGLFSPTRSVISLLLCCSSRFYCIQLQQMLQRLCHSLQDLYYFLLLCTHRGCCMLKTQGCRQPARSCLYSCICGCWTIMQNS